MGQDKEGSRAVKLSLNITEGLKGIEDLGQLEISDGSGGEQGELGQTKETMVGCVQEELRKEKYRIKGQRSEFLFSDGQGVEQMLTFSAPQFFNM